MEDLLIDCKNVSLDVRGASLIRDVSFQLKKGESCAIIGPNGSGKSTLIKTILGLHKAQGGSLYLMGREIKKVSLIEKARLVAYVPQLLAADIPYSVREFVGMGRYAFHGASTDDEVNTAMERAGVTQFENRVVGTLSGGERQRVCIAAALAQQASLLILDEPLSHLDPGQREVVKDLVQKISSEVAVLTVTHDIEWARSAFDSLLVMKKGELLYSGESSAYFEEVGLVDLFDYPKGKGGR